MSAPSLTEFLLARVAEDEHAASLKLSEIQGLGGGMGYVPPGSSYNPRVLAECEAKRRIVEHCTSTATCGGYMPPGPERDEYDAELGFTPARHLPEEYAAGCDGCSAAESVAMSDDWIVKCLALPYRDHPDYRAEWEL